MEPSKLIIESFLSELSRLNTQKKEKEASEKHLAERLFGVSERK